MSNKNISDNAEFTTNNIDELISFLREREATGRWFTDEDGCAVNGIRFTPIYPEPICVPAEVQRLKASSTNKFTSSEEAYADTMYCPQNGYYGSSQMMLVKGRLYPVGNSAIRGILARSGLGADGFEKLQENDPNGLSDVLNILLKNTDSNATVLVQDEKIRAVNGGKYAICPISFVAETTKQWMESERPNAEFVLGYFSHDYAWWQVSLEKYTDEIFANFMELKNAGFVPALLVKMSNTGKNAVSLNIALKSNNLVFPVGNDIAVVHKAKGTASERTLQMQDAVKANFASVFSELQKGFDEISRMKKITVNNAYNALLRGMKELKLPKVQAMEAAMDFEVMFGTGSCTAYDCFLTVTEALSYVSRDFPNNHRKLFECAESVARASSIRWDKHGEIPGNFSW